MDILLTNINWLAVIIGAVASFALGWLWYSPKMFGTKWATGSGMTLEPGTKMPMLAMVAQAGSTFVLAWAVGVAKALELVPLALLFTVAIMGLIKANALFAKKNFYAVAVETGFIAAMVAVMLLAHAVV